MFLSSVWRTSTASASPTQTATAPEQVQVLQDTIPTLVRVHIGEQVNHSSDQQDSCGCAMPGAGCRSIQGARPSASRRGIAVDMANPSPFHRRWHLESARGGGAASHIRVRWQADAAF